MTKERVKELLSILQAYAEGKAIQYRVVEYEDWHDVDNEDGINEGTRYEYRIKPSDKYTEIFKLKEMLEDAGIPFEWIEHNDFKNGYQICYPEKDGKCVCSVIEHSFSYGSEEDLLEIQGLLTSEEEKDDSVLGHLTADNVFSRISAHWEKVNNPSYRPFMDSAELILEWIKKTGIETNPMQEPLIWVKHKVDDRRRLITCFGENSFGDKFVELGNKAKPVTMQRLFEMYTFLDGTPVGKQKEE